MKQVMKQAQQSLAQFWMARDARERKMLSAAVTLIAIALIYTLLINPSWSGRIQLNKDLPALRQQVAQLQSLAKEAAAFSDKPSTPLTMITRESIELSLARKGLKAQSVMLTGDMAQVKLASASFAGTLGWLEEMQKNVLFLVTEANIEALTQPDMVNATLTLRQARNE